MIEVLIGIIFIAIILFLSYLVVRAEAKDVEKKVQVASKPASKPVLKPATGVPYSFKDSTEFYNIFLKYSLETEDLSAQLRSHSFYVDRVKPVLFEFLDLVYPSRKDLIVHEVQDKSVYVDILKITDDIVRVSKDVSFMSLVGSYSEAAIERLLFSGGVLSKEPVLSANFSDYGKLYFKIKDKDYKGRDLLFLYNFLRTIVFILKENSKRQTLTQGNKVYLTYLEKELKILPDKVEKEALLNFNDFAYTLNIPALSSKELLSKIYGLEK